jgi:hypothetical protein
VTALGLGNSRPGRPASKSGYVRDAAESGSRFRALAASATDVIQAPKLEPRIMRYELSDYEWTVFDFARFSPEAGSRFSPACSMKSEDGEKSFLFSKYGL